MDMMTEIDRLDQFKYWVEKAAEAKQGKKGALIIKARSIYKQFTWEDEKRLAEEVSKYNNAEVKMALAVGLHEPCYTTFHIRLVDFDIENL